jgi:hypothetical protein
MSTAVSKMTDERSNLIMVPTNQLVTNDAFAAPSGFDVTIYGNGVNMNPAADVFISTNDTLTLIDLNISGNLDPDQTLVQCTAGSLRVIDSHLANSGIGIDADQCNVEVTTSVFDTFSGGGLSSICTACDTLTFNVSRSIFREAPTAIFTGVSNSQIVNNIFQDVALASYNRGIQLSAIGALFAFNTIYRSGSCLYTGTVSCTGNELLVSSNLTYANTEAAGPCYDQVYYQCDNAGLENTLEHAFAETTWPGATNASGDPLMTNPNGGDFSLQAGSPAIDFGNPDIAPVVDFYGNPRSVGAAPDAGAIEFQ